MYQRIENNFKPQFTSGFNELEDDLATEGILFELANLIIENSPESNKQIEKIISEWDITRANINGDPLLIFAMHQHNFEACKMLIRFGLNLEELGRNGIAEDGTALHMAAIMPDSRYLDLIVAQGANLNACGYASQETALARAIENCFFQNAYRLIEYGADINRPDVNGQTPIFNAVRIGNQRLVYDLYGFGAKIDIVNKKEQNLLHYNLIHGDFLPHEDDDGEMVIIGDKMTKLLIYLGCYTDVADKGGNRPLHYACSLQRRESARCLIVDNDVDVNAQNNMGTTPLHWAVGRKDLYLLNLLLKYDADPNLMDDTESTPLHFAAQLNFLPGIRLLLQHGAVKSLTNKFGTQPIDLTTDLMCANLLSVPKYGTDLDSLYNKASETERRAAFRHYMIAKQCWQKNNGANQKD